MSRDQRLLRVERAQHWHDFRTLYANPAEEQGVIWMAMNRTSGKGRTMTFPICGLIRRLDYRELAIGWEKRELEPSNFRQSPKAILVDLE
jgi:hypothetical protein